MRGPTRSRSRRRSSGAATRPRRRGRSSSSHRSASRRARNARRSADHRYSDSDLARVGASFVVDRLDGTIDAWPTVQATLAALDFDATVPSDMHHAWSEPGESLRPALVSATGATDAKVRAAGL